MQQDAASLDTLTGRQDVVTGSARHVPGRGWIAEPSVTAAEEPTAEGSVMPIQGSFRGDAAAEARTTVRDDIGQVVTGAFRGEGDASP